MNNVVLIGRLTKDPDLKFAKGSGTGVAKFGIAVNRRMKKGEADFINCIAFGKTAETIAQYFTKGSQIAIQGHIQTGSYDNQAGQKVYTTDVVIDSFDFIEKGQAKQNNSYSTDAVSGEGYTPVDDGEMLF
jgi:single-strand DNA-binding protein